MSAGLASLLQLDEETKKARGLLHTPGEIARQPEIWPKTVRAMHAHANRLRELLDGVHDVLLTGAGSSYFIGKSLERALAGHLKARVTAVPSTEVVMDPEATLPRSSFLLVSFARSGNSPEGNATFQLADRLRPGQVRHLVVTCNPEGTLASLARATESPAVLCELPEANDQGLAMTNSFTSMFVAALALGYLDDLEAHAHVVEGLAQSGGEVLGRHDKALEDLANRDFRRAFFIGSGASYGAALECHLKVQELTDGEVVGKAEETLGLRHGPMAAIAASSLVVLFASSSPYRRQYETDLLRELHAKALGLQRVVVCGRAEPEWRDLVHHVIEFDPVGRLSTADEVLPPVQVIVGQLLGLFASIRSGLAPDAPSRHGVIHRVVEGVRIYSYGPIGP
ncbi:SIS domain-containing protein [Limnochorda pilosa]|uniref:Sugar isomerase (SIS) n=1 Tax=Limnochorda pilosa TaxID=1555112 RepID=A0A0K2SM48_LIMPI|nr:SIS domain-containing protein [Limnochorda pilosa]BAS27909.1 sugar isomerase (SIS) [Limnochorda pilosa]